MKDCIVQWFPKWAVPSPLGAVRNSRGGEVEMDDWGAVRQKRAVGGR